MGGYEIYEKLRKERGLRDSDVSRMTGIGSGTLSDWKKGRYELKTEKMKKIAEALDVSIDTLMGQREGYYADDGVRELAEFITKNPAYRSLFDAAMRVKKEDIDFVKEMIERTTNDG